MKVVTIPQSCQSYPTCHSTPTARPVYSCVFTRAFDPCMPMAWPPVVHWHAQADPRPGSGCPSLCNLTEQPHRFAAHPHTPRPRAQQDSRAQDANAEARQGQASASSLLKAGPWEHTQLSSSE